MKKVSSVLLTVAGMILLLGGLLLYGLGVHALISVQRPGLLVIGTSLIGTLLIYFWVLRAFCQKNERDGH